MIAYGPNEHIAPKRALPFLLAIHGLTCPDCFLPMWHDAFPESMAAADKGHPFDRRPNARRRATVDHVVPRCAGGLNTWGNYQAVCQSCNGRRQGAWRRRNPDWRDQLRTRREASSWQ